MYRKCDLTGALQQSCLMARVDELRDQYEIDLEQIGEAWLRMQKQAGAWFDEMKNKLTWKCVIHTI